MALQMPPVPPRDDVKATWRYIEAGVEKIMADPRGGIDMQTYMGIYTAIRNFCTAQKVTASSSFASHNNRGGAHLLGEDLYQHLIEYLKSHLKNVQAHSKEHVDEALLTFYIKEWNRYTTAGRYNNHLFRYLNRHWVKREMDEGKKNIYDIYTLHLVRWKEDMFTGTQEQVMRSVLKLVEKQRNGETIEQSYIKSIVDSFVSLGLDESDNSKSTLDVYKKYFEKPFLEVTTQYYDNESKQFLAKNTVAKYVKWVLARLNEEKERARGYLCNETLQPLMEACAEALITHHSRAFRDASLDSRDNEGREPLSWVAENGHEAMAKLLLGNPNVDPDPSDNKGRTPLSLAAENGHEAIVKLLLGTEKVNVNLKDNISRTPLSLAAENGHEAIVQLLLNTKKVDVDLGLVY